MPGRVPDLLERTDNRRLGATTAAADPGALPHEHPDDRSEEPDQPECGQEVAHGPDRTPPTAAAAGPRYLSAGLRLGSPTRLSGQATTTATAAATTMASSALTTAGLM
jgi:hypothetical protein